MMIDEREFYGSAEACDVLGVGRATLYAYVSRGLLRSYRRGRKRTRLYRQSEVAALAASGSGGPCRRDSARELPTAESWIPYT